MSGNKIQVKVGNGNRQSNRLPLPLLTFLQLLIFSNLSSQNVFDNVSNRAFQSGEKLNYTVSYSGWLNVGEANFEIKPDTGILSGKNLFHIVGTGKSNYWWDWFFKVRDKYETTVRKETLLPVKFNRNVFEGGYSFTESITFQHKEKKAISNRKSYNISADIQDVLSAIYFFRALDFSKVVPNEILPVKVAIDDTVHNLKIQYIGKGVIKIKTGTYHCLIFRPDLIPGTIFKSNTKMDLWVSDDENKLPLKVKTEILVGSIVVELNSYSGLRNPISSKVK